MKEITKDTTRKELFGCLDASDEEESVLKNYFLETTAYKKVNSNENIYILVGEKGTGKSAIMKMCMINDKENNHIFIDIHRAQVDEELDINKKIDAWKDYLAKAIYDSLQTEPANYQIGLIKNILETCASGILEKKYGINYNSIKEQIVDALDKQGKDIKIYIDDLDTGYRGTKKQDESIIALFTAIREMIRKNRNLKFRITIRTDVYDNIRRIDEASDKIQDAKIDLIITNHQILAMLTKRILSFCGIDSPLCEYEHLSQSKMIEKMNIIFEPFFEGRGKWEHKATSYILMTMTRKRPRDLFVLCGLAWDNAIKNNRTKILSQDLQSVFNEYSVERLRDAISEYNHEFNNKNDFKELILALKPSKKKMQNIYTKDELINKVKTITERKNFYFADGTKAENYQLAATLYKTNIVVGRKDKNNLIKRIYYMEEPDLISELTNQGCNFEVHPAYRWAIEGLNENLLDNIDIEDDDL